MVLGMEELPSTLNFLYLTFKAFLGIAKSTEEGPTKLAVLLTVTGSTPTPTFTAPTAGSAHP